jgi:hippurate hydrolase
MRVKDSGRHARPAHRSAAADRGNDVLTAARAVQPHTLALRRDLHRHPEQGLHLPRTQRAVLTALDGLPLRIHQGRSSTSVVAVLEGTRPGPVVLLRGDMDALPLIEETGLPFASTEPGSMHACGHDTHTAMLASAARLLAQRREDLAGTVLFAFQPGEEGHHGARHMIEEGLLDASGPGGAVPERALALHITSTLRSGLLQTRPGPIMAAADVLRVTVTGRGGHAATPYDACDPVVAAAAIVGGLQTAVTRSIPVFDPAVLTVAHITAGTTNNIIPETAFMEGTLRTFSRTTRTRMHERLHQVAIHAAAAYGCTAEVEIEAGYPVTSNDDAIAGQVLAIGRKVLGRAGAEPMPDPMMGAEDWSYVLQKVPGAMAFLGACPPGQEPDASPPNHSNRVVFDEDALAAGVAMYTSFALDALHPKES